MSRWMELRGAQWAQGRKERVESGRSIDLNGPKGEKTHRNDVEESAAP